MSKVISKFVCQNCAYTSPRWIGKCPNCNEWNSLVEEIVSKVSKKNSKPIGSSSQIISIDEISFEENLRTKTNIEEFDRVLGGGIVEGSVILVGGDPGIGKSTLMMQVASYLSNKIVLYITSEESAKQIRLRLERLKIKLSKSIFVLAETNMDIVLKLISEHKVDILIVDSIQAMYFPQLETTAGSVSQVREISTAFTRFAKENSVSIFLIGHVNKDGMIAGPKVIEHLVDTVLQFEGDKNYFYRILRSLKNRFGSTNEIGIFQMLETGLKEVKNPSEFFLTERKNGISGSSIISTLEGSRPILIEVQALVTKTSFNIPQRNSTGFDLRRMSMLVSLLEKRVGIYLGTYDIFTNVVGGIKLDDTASDLGIICAIVSSLKDKPIDLQTVIIGEVGLGGEVRSVSQIEKRINEAIKLGFKKIFLPQNNSKEISTRKEIKIVAVEDIYETIEKLFDDQ